MPIEILLQLTYFIISTGEVVGGIQQYQVVTGGTGGMLESRGSACEQQLQAERCSLLHQPP